MNSFGRMDPACTIPRPTPGLQIRPSSTNNQNNDALKPQGWVARMRNPFGDCQGVVKDNNIIGTEHTAMGAVPWTVERYMGSDRTPLLAGELPFRALENAALDSHRVQVVIYSGGKEHSLESFITGIDPNTKTFTVMNPFNELGAGASNTRIIFDVNDLASITAGVVTALADGRADTLRCVRSDSQIEPDSFPKDRPIFNFRLLDPQRVEELKGRIGTTPIRLKEGQNVADWKVPNAHNVDLRGTTLHYTDQLAYAGHLVFEMFQAVVGGYCGKNMYSEDPIPVCIGDMEPYTTEESTGPPIIHGVVKNNLGKKAVIDGRLSLSMSNGDAIHLEINVDAPYLDPKTGKYPEGPHCPHVGLKICSGKDLKVVGHVLVSEVDGFRPQR